MKRFNRTWQVKPPLSSGLIEGLLAAKVKDVSLRAIERHYPQYLRIVEHLEEFLPAKKYLSVTISTRDYAVGESTCMDAGWHTDGSMSADDPEHYAMVCFGPDGSRTMFCEEPLTGYVDEAPASIKERTQFFGSLMQRDLHNEAGGFEVPNGCPVLYTTFDIHKGRKVINAGKRVFVRVMVSNLIRPKPL